MSSFVHWIFYFYCWLKSLKFLLYLSSLVQLNTEIQKRLIMFDCQYIVMIDHCNQDQMTWYCFV